MFPSIYIPNIGIAQVSLFIAAYTHNILIFIRKTYIHFFKKASLSCETLFFFLLYGQRKYITVVIYNGDNITAYLEENNSAAHTWRHTWKKNKYYFICYAREEDSHRLWNAKQTILRFQNCFFFIYIFVKFVEKIYILWAELKFFPLLV